MTPLDASRYNAGNPRNALAPLCRGTRPPHWLRNALAPLLTNQ
ncbi:hypothetical protein [Chlorogloeopsis fritschii]|nr:hypothetical protein [Chlorogloeopsis fritschii]